MNKILLVGRLGQNCEAREVNGQWLASFSIATSETYKAKDGNKKEVTEWHNCTLWGDRSKALAPYLVKGKLISVEGSIHYSKSEQNGVTRYYTDIRVDNVELLGGAESKPQPQQEQKVTVGHVDYPVSSQPFHRPGAETQVDDLPF